MTGIKDETKGRIMMALAAHGHDGLTVGEIAKRVSKAKGWVWKVLQKLMEEGEVFKCELPHGFHYQYTQTLYFTAARIAELNGGMPKAGRVFIIRQRIITEIKNGNGDEIVKSFTN